MTPQIALGASDFKEIIENGYYYIDKTAFIAEVLQDADKVLLFPRPRRFGKTLNLSMLRYFLEKTAEERGGLFQRLAVANDVATMAHMGRYPTLSITFKDLNVPTYQACLSMLQRLSARLYNDHRYLLEGDTLSGVEKKWFTDVLEMHAEPTALMESLGQLIHYLHRYHHERVVLLIDEYDSPIHAGYHNRWYEEIVGFMRGLLSAALKDNSSLKKGVLTGILRVAKESIFSGLNNISVYSILSASYSDAFGFTEGEVERALHDFGRESSLPDVQRWYNGYLFGGQVIYNPWSVAGWLKERSDALKPHWINTSGNEIIREMVMQNDLRQDVEILLNGGTLVKALDENVSFRDLEHAPELVWGLFTFSGYLKVTEALGPPERRRYRLALPNREVQIFFETAVSTWAHKHFGRRQFELALQALVTGELELFEDYLVEILKTVASYQDLADEPEAFFHAFVLGMLVSFQGQYQLRSNRESGHGRYDVMLEPEDKSQMGLVLEFKKVNARREKGWEEAMAAALAQIREREYARELKDRGVDRILGVGIVFVGKDARVQGIPL